MNKTNKYWYQYIAEGSYYKLKNGILWYISMNSDGTPEIDDGVPYESEVELDMLEGDYIDDDHKVLVTDRLKEITKELEGKE